MKELIQYDCELKSSTFGLLAGVDEAGRGPLAGPVVAAAVILPEEINIYELDDSKKLSAAVRERLASEIKVFALDWSIGIAAVKEIELLNIHWAALLAMKRAAKNLKLTPQCLLVDGRFKIPGIEIFQHTIIGGDGLSASIAAASILAKVTRDHLMRIYHQIYPDYGFDQHKGYATAAHLRKLSIFGPCPIHRKGFRPVKKLRE